MSVNFKRSSTQRLGWPWLAHINNGQWHRLKLLGFSQVFGTQCGLRRVTVMTGYLRAVKKARDIN